MHAISYRRYRFAEVIGYAVWAPFRFSLSLRMVEEMLAARRSAVDYRVVIPARLGRPDDGTAVFLASDDASFVTGINLMLDGGWTAARALHRSTGETQMSELDLAIRGGTVVTASDTFRAD